MPYLIVCLLIILGSKMFNIFDKNAIDLASKDDTVFNFAEPNLAQAAIEIDDKAHEYDKNQNTEELNKIIQSIKNDSENIVKDEKIYDRNIKDLPNVGCISYIKREFSPTEVDILKSLKQRREELENREQELLFKENTIQLTKNQIIERLSTLQLLKDELQVIIRQYDTKEGEKNAKLVRIYESMKPKEAARIFEEMQLNVLLEVVEKMRETRLAPILASMEPFKAKEITVALVNRRKSIHN
ncbi:MotE family protein [Candidatus Midichloria mitochondrii]|nr:hypothetical protein [Candidatus Midichloria mitochondrii]